MFEYYQNTLCVQGGWMVESGVLTMSHYKQLIHRSFLNLLRRGGNGRTALIEFDTMRPDIKEKVVAIAGDPKEVAPRSALEKYIERDLVASDFYKTFRKPDGKSLSEEKQLEYVTNARILNAVDLVVFNAKANGRKLNGWKNRMWEEISNAVNTLPSKSYPHTIPGNCRSLQRLYTKYKASGYSCLIHGQLGNDNSRKITGDVADFFIAMYGLPNKPVIPMILSLYDQKREEKGWPSLTEQAVSAFLNQPDIERLWRGPRHGKESWMNKYAHHLKRDRSEWFPNAYWAIDGTKLDWVHYEDNDRKMAAKLKIDPVFDVFSEKILGWSYSETENHIDHFTAIKQAMNAAQTRPYYMTYDNQSGHKMNRMQDLYDSIVARDGGLHHPHKAGEKNNPVEGIFNRLQQQVIGTFWFADKQSIKSRDEDNVPNPDYLDKVRKLFHTKDELQKAWELVVKLWNEAEHPNYKGMSRNEVYAMEQKMAEPVSFLEMIDMFWISETRGNVYKRGGIELRVGNDIHWFEVLDQDGTIDVDFRRKYVGSKFLVRYDAESLDTYIQLLQLDSNGDKVLVAHAQPKREHQVIPVLMKEGDKSAYLKDYKVRGTEYELDQSEFKAIMLRTGITPDTMMEEQELMIKLGGHITKEERHLTEEQMAILKM